ncbi:4-hydroxy-tetrahydrodipicolinate reductase [bacterium]|nr:MAG: 4-hydroxy-tetrahydrodipicolinate reductase [bacterium]
MTPIRAAVAGAAGRMGRETLRALTAEHGFHLVAAIDRTEVGRTARELAGPDVADVTLGQNLSAALDGFPADVLVDFSHHSVAADHALEALKRGTRFVIGCTGLSAEQVEALGVACETSGLGGMIVPNFAVGAVLMMRFAQMAAKWMPDAEIIELHHDRKEDAPSGTAMRTAELIADARTSPKTELPTPHFKAEGARGGEVSGVPVHSIRLPGLLAHQEVIFGTRGETLTLRHDSYDRVGFMPGVRLAARSVLERPGLTIGLESVMFPED